MAGWDARDGRRTGGAVALRLGLSAKHGLCPRAAALQVGTDRRHHATFLRAEWLRSGLPVFLLSGASLTYSFSRQPCSVVLLVLPGVIRLGLPMVAAILFGA